MRRVIILSLQWGAWGAVALGRKLRNLPLGNL
jgi:hypothetical protein